MVWAKNNEFYFYQGHSQRVRILQQDSNIKLMRQLVQIGLDGIKRGGGGVWLLSDASESPDCDLFHPVAKGVSVSYTHLTLPTKRIV